ncbi:MULTISPECIES: bifunctional diguanylate cyclase/phosphodiesterase [unclassified Agarivorans]|uniref:bifunctional diguanylate cyclase/phosphodiesterase n=1 Tax=unclassified Agarivorans TaxID=2636026 RepID=UPI0026E27B4F|nr:MULTISPECIES: EAL domain-containing protein [unclassified Agarivorans]MDO6687931.1 EAL domain-containing protein [Agarivorans sp. 3_MG-2023]MDO6717553.1 EAL domain-containing protein [Agarivorans sp. 2_MG-2023]
MTLYRQLLIVVLLIYGGLLAVVFSIEIGNTRSYLSEQQLSDVNNTSTSLGLSLSPYLEDGDVVGAESVINAMFDSGYYQQISLTLFADESVIDRQNSSAIEGVPEWFTSFELFQPSSQQQVLTSGWMQLGELTVVGHSGFAYLQLWNAMVDLAKLFVVGYLATVLMLMRALRYVLKPLEQIQQQAKLIEQREFGQTIPLPHTLELRSVVGAINHMSDNIAQQFESQVKEANALREQAFQDSVSGLGNRAYFINQSKSWLAESGVGGLALISLDIIEAIHVKEGFSARDEFIHSVGELFTAYTQQQQQLVFARISNLEFAVLAEGFDQQQLLDLAQQVHQDILERLATWKQYMPRPLVIGLVLRQKDENIGELLTAADTALHVARELREGFFSLADVEHTHIPRSQWKQLLETTISRQSLAYKTQIVNFIHSDKVLHHELFTTIEVDAQHYAAGQFMPAVEQFRLGAKFDQMVVEQAASALSKHADLSLAINLTLSAISEQSFLTWLGDAAVQFKSVAHRMAFEIPETAFLQENAELEKTLGLLRALGFQIGIDQYGRNLNSLSYLSRVKPNYVKIDYGYTAQALAEEGDTHFLSAICRAARNLQIVTVAQRVENQQQVELLSALPVDAYQGYVAPPQRFKLAE